MLSTPAPGHRGGRGAAVAVAGRRLQQGVCCSGGAAGAVPDAWAAQCAGEERCAEAGWFRKRGARRAGSLRASLSAARKRVCASQFLRTRGSCVPASQASETGPRPAALVPPVPRILTNTSRVLSCARSLPLSAHGRAPSCACFSSRCAAGRHVDVAAAACGVAQRGPGQAPLFLMAYRLFGCPLVLGEGTDRTANCCVDKIVLLLVRGAGQEGGRGRGEEKARMDSRKETVMDRTAMIDGDRG